MFVSIWKLFILSLFQLPIYFLIISVCYWLFFSSINKRNRLLPDMFCIWYWCYIYFTEGHYEHDLCVF